MKIGIDAISYYVPSHYLPIEALANARNIEYAKLNKGLGLTSMSFPDVDEDAASMGANAVLDMFQRESLDPATVGRMYLGTESALDSAKPTATYILDLVEQELAAEHGERCLKNVDAVDMTFACIGAVDALENACLYAFDGTRSKVAVNGSDLVENNRRRGRRRYRPSPAHANGSRNRPRRSSHRRPASGHDARGYENFKILFYCHYSYGFNCL